MKNKKIIAGLILSATLLSANTSAFAAKESYEKGIFYDENEKPANWWYDDGDDWFFFKDGKKLTGEGTDANGKHQFENGKYVKGYRSGIFYKDGNICSWWADDGDDWFFFKDGEKVTGKATDANGRRYFVNGKYANGAYDGIFFKNGIEVDYIKENKTTNTYIKGIFYDENKKPANWWYDDGTDWFFFKDGKRFTGKAADANGEHQFINGKYIKGYKSKIFYKDGNICSWWADDGEDWFFFKDGKKLTGVGKDNNGEHLFEKGKYVKGYKDNKFYDDGKLANWWYDDGNDWYFFKNGKKLTGEGTDANGKHYFVNGKYGKEEKKENKEQKENKTTNTYIKGIFYDENKKPANWWYDDGTGWFFFKDGKKLTGEGTDANGKRYFVNGKYANGDFKNAFYKNGKVKYYKNGKYKNTLVYKNYVLEIGAYAGSDEVKAYANRREDRNAEQAYIDEGHILVDYHPLDFTDGKGSELSAHNMDIEPLWKYLKNGEIITIYDIHGNYANFKMKLDITILSGVIDDDWQEKMTRVYNLAQKEENIQVSFCRNSIYKESWLGEICN